MITLIRPYTMEWFIGEYYKEKFDFSIDLIIISIERFINTIDKTSFSMVISNI